MPVNKLSEKIVCDVSVLLTFPLHIAAGRTAFLHEYYWQGEEALLAAVAHIWGSMAEPRNARGTTMGQISGAGGKGKLGVLWTLKKFLAECLSLIEPIPSRSDYETLAEWHDASLQSFADDERRVWKLCSIYAAVLDGDQRASDKIR